MKKFNFLIFMAFLAMLAACNVQNKEKKTLPPSIANSSIDMTAPVFMHNEANTVLYDEASINGKVITKLVEESNQSLIGLSAVKDAENRIWHRCYYPKEQIEGWTLQANHWNLPEDEKYLPFLQNLALAHLKLGANPTEARRLLGKPRSELTKKGPLEVSGYKDEDTIVTTTTLDFDGICLVYEDDRMVYAYITKPGKGFGSIICGDKGSSKDSLIEKFKLTDDDFYQNDEGDQAIVINREIISLILSFNEDNLVKTIEMKSGP